MIVSYMAVASGPAGPVLAGPVLRRISKVCMRKTSQRDDYKLSRYPRATPSWHVPALCERSAKRRERVYYANSLTTWRLATPLAGPLAKCLLRPCHSLVPRLPCLTAQESKNRGESLVHFITWVTSRVEGRRENLIARVGRPRYPYRLRT